MFTYTKTNIQYWITSSTIFLTYILFVNCNIGRRRYIDSNVVVKVVIFNMCLNLSEQEEIQFDSIN
jgi:hypothetical protein